jgi:type II secretory pathway pseudopilin PulG
MRSALPSRLLRRSTSARSASSEAGETLIEVMVSMMILGISVVAILGALWVVSRTGDQNQKTSNAELVLRDFSDTLKGRGVTNIGSTTYDATYKDCAALGTTGSYPTYTPPEPNEHYRATITKIEFLNGYSGTAPVWRAQSQGCPSGGDQGLERLTLRVQTPSGTTGPTADETTVIVKRNTTGETGT